MQRRKSLVIGTICGIVCMAALLLYAQELEDEVQKERAETLARFGGEQIEAYVAVRDIAVGEVLDATNCERRLWVGELLPQDAVLNLDEVEGMVLTSPVYAGEAITSRRFSQDAAPVLQVPDGLCAVSVPSKPVSAVGGSIEAGSSVDVYSTSGVATERIAASVLVLSTSAAVQEGGQGSDISWVTLAVDPRLVEGLIAAAQKAELYFALPAEGGVADVVGELSEEDPLEGAEENADVETEESDGRVADGSDGASD